MIPPAVGAAALYLQFVPSLLQFITAASLAAAGFIVVLLLTVLFGRVFCSTLCPLGTLQDIIIRLSERWKKPRRVRFRYKKPQTPLRYGILLITVITLLYGSSVAINLLDPFSNFGRLIADLIRPIYIGVTNLIVSLLEFFNVYLLHPAEWKLASLITLVFPLLFLGLLIGLSVGKGRLYCNTLCPVGALLGLVSRFPYSKLKSIRTPVRSAPSVPLTAKPIAFALKPRKSISAAAWPASIASRYVQGLGLVISHPLTLATGNSGETVCPNLRNGHFSANPCFIWPAWPA